MQVIRGLAGLIVVVMGSRVTVTVEGGMVKVVVVVVVAGLIDVEPLISTVTVGPGVWTVVVRVSVT